MGYDDDEKFGTDDKSTLVRVEQQLKDSVKNQTQIRDDLKTIFDKIEKESKIISSIRANVQAHLEASVVRKEDLQNRLKVIEERHNELKESHTKFKEETRSKIEKDSDDKDFNQLKQDFIEFKTEILTSVSVTRWIFGGLFSVILLIVAILEILSYLKGTHS